MKAITYRKYGPPEVLRLEEYPKPEPGGDEILIKVQAVEATKSDCEFRCSRFAVKWFWLPLRIATGVFRPRNPVLGGYFSGIVDRVGKNVTKFKKGDSVFGSAGLRLGAYAEYLCLKENAVIITRPANLDHIHSAAMGLGGFNALHFMRLAKIRKGESVLINGAGASIGTFAVQIAKLMGAKVTAVDSAHKGEMLRSIGADHFIDYQQEDFTKNGGRWDVIFNMVAGCSYSDCIKSLEPGGRYLMGNPRLIDMLRSFITPVHTDRRVYFAFAPENRDALFELKELIESGKIRPAVDKVYPLADAAEAHKRVESEERSGIVILRAGDQAEF
ncbi:MAG: NAD(P)-dependent alcohol dehydrogenase [Deltaproteobacteria bacterium]|nr:NAD(P)-dependent alcohol dehydrogenase [Deltaproteobacteria bacterium]